MKTLVKLCLIFTPLFCGCVKIVDSLYISNKEYEVKKIPAFREVNGFFFFNDKKGFAVGDSGLVFKTTDGGETWQKKSVGDFNLQDVHFGNDNDGFIVGYVEDKKVQGDTITYGNPHGVVLRTIDGGETWETNEINISAPSSVYCINKNNAIIPYVNSIYITHDGKNWEEISIGYIEKKIPGGIEYISMELNEIYQSNDTTFIAFGQDGSIMTTDYFKSWKNLSYKAEHTSVLANNHLFSSIDNFIYSSVADTNQRLLTEVKFDDYEFSINDLEGIDENYFYIIANGLHRTQNGGKTWETIIPRDGRYKKLQRIGTEYIFGIGGSQLMNVWGRQQYLIKIKL